MADNASAFRILDDRIARLRVVANLPDDAMPDVAAAIAKDVDRQIAAGETPDGKPWEPRQDGGAPLRNIGKHISVGIVGRTVIVRIRSKHVVLHHFGFNRGRGTPKEKQRQILPIGKIPASMARAIREAIGERFGGIMSGGG
jgi:hypothetical protein